MDTWLLVVEDDPVLRANVVEVLSEEGYRAVGAPNGAAALGLIAPDGAAPSHPALILLDMRMPVMDGWTFADAYRALPGPHAPIVVMSAGHDVPIRAAQIGAASYLEKPFDLDALLALVAQMASSVTPPAPGTSSSCRCD